MGLVRGTPLSGGLAFYLLGLRRRAGLFPQQHLPHHTPVRCQELGKRPSLVEGCCPVHLFVDCHLVHLIQCSRDLQLAAQFLSHPRHHCYRLPPCHFCTTTNTRNVWRSVKFATASQQG